MRTCIYIIKNISTSRRCRSMILTAIDKNQCTCYALAISVLDSTGNITFMVLTDFDIVQCQTEVVVWSAVQEREIIITILCRYRKILTNTAGAFRCDDNLIDAVLRCNRRSLAEAESKNFRNTLCTCCSIESNLVMLPCLHGNVWRDEPVLRNEAIVSILIAYTLCRSVHAVRIAPISITAICIDNRPDVQRISRC